MMISPGPNFVAVSFRALSRSRKEALVLTSGIATGSMIWAIMAMSGIKILFSLFL